MKALGVWFDILLVLGSRWFCRRFLPYQYDLGKKLAEAGTVRRTWEPDREGRLTAWARFNKEWRRQVQLERLIGKRLAGWVKRKSGLVYCY